MRARRACPGSKPIAKTVRLVRVCCPRRVACGDQLASAGRAVLEQHDMVAAPPRQLRAEVGCLSEGAARPAGLPAA